MTTSQLVRDPILGLVCRSNYDSMIAALHGHQFAVGLGRKLAEADEA